MLKADVYNYFNQKYGSNAAYGITANVDRESTFNPSAVGDNGQAYGLFQWNRKGSPDRYANFKRLFGKDLTKSTAEEQIQFADWEIQHYGIDTKLMNADSPSEAAKIFVYDFERPLDKVGESAKRGKLAEQMAGNSGSLFEMGGRVGNGIANVGRSMFGYPTVDYEDTPQAQAAVDEADSPMYGVILRGFAAVFGIGLIYIGLIKIKG